MTLIFIASSMPTVPSLPGGLSDYTGHFIGYSLLGALAIRGFARARWSGVNGPAAIRAVVMSSMYGVTDEFHQSFVPGRSPSVADWGVDTLGAIVAASAALMLARIIARNRANRGV